jgi:HEAT repeat protein/S1-C subfamily serine protease
MIHFTCPECEAELEVGDNKAGTRLLCPECQHRVLVPGPVKKASEPEGKASGAGYKLVDAGAKPSDSGRKPSDSGRKPSDSGRKPSDSARQPGDSARSKPTSISRRSGKTGSESGVPRRSGNRGLLIAAVGGGIGLCVLIAIIAFLAMGSGGSNRPSSPSFASNSSGSSGARTPPVTAPAPNAGASSAEPSKTETPSGSDSKSEAKTVAKADTKAESPEKTEPDKPADEKQAASTDTVLAPTQVTKEDIASFVLKSTVWIMTLSSVNKDGEPASGSEGSGALIDRENRWVLTAEHVVHHGTLGIAVLFPIYRDGNLVTEKMEYIKQFKRADVLRARVLASDEKRDLALLELEGQIPETALALPVARVRAKAGQSVHTLGNPGGSSTLWLYTPGEVRQTTHMKWHSGDKEKKELQEHEANVILTNSLVNPGDSGGPLVNDSGELTGVVHGLNPKVSALSLFIDGSEVLTFIEDYAKSHNITWHRDIRKVKPKVRDTDVLKLARSLSSKDPAIRADAAQKLGTIGPDARLAIQELVKRMKDDSDDLTRRFCREALDQIGAPDKGDLNYLKTCLKDPSSTEVRAYAAGAIGKIGTEARSASSGLLQAMRDREAAVRQNAARSLGNIGADKGTVLPVLTSALKDPDRDVRIAAAEAMTSLGSALSKSDLPVFREMLKHEDPEVQAAALRSVGFLIRDAKPLLPDIQSAFSSSDHNVRRASLETLLRFGQDAKPAIPVFTAGLEDGDKDVRRQACEALASFGVDSKAAVPKLAVALSDSDVLVRKAAVVALGKVGPEAKAAAAALGDSLKEDDPGFLNAALQTVAKLGPAGKDAVPGLIKLFRTEIPTGTRNEVAKTIGKIGKDAVPDLSRGIRDLNPMVVMGCSAALGEIGPTVRTTKQWKEIRSQLVALADGGLPLVNSAASDALNRINRK